MIAILIFPIIAAGLVLLAGRKDSARDPNLTFLLLVLLAALPAMVALLPKFGFLSSHSASTPNSSFPWQALLIAIWIAGFLFHLGKIFFAGFIISRWRKKSVFLENTAGIALRMLPHLRSPIATGIFRKTIFIPSDWASLPLVHREIVLAHEIAHHHRHDPLLRLCVELARAINWWNPLVHWMASRYILQSECACDEFVLRQGTDPKAYAKVLCDFAEEHSPNFFALAMADTSSLERRVGRILARKNSSGLLLFIALGMLGLTAASALSMLGNQPSPDPQEVKLRLSANPFPGN